MKRLTLLLCALLITPMMVNLSIAAENWEFVIAPYALIPSIDGDTSIGRVEGLNVDVGPSDILNNLDLGGMIQVEIHHNSGFGLIAAYNFMDLSGEASTPGGEIKLEPDIYQGIFEGYGAYRLGRESGPLDIYAGIRWWDIDVELDANGNRLVENKSDWVDPVIGARWTPAISQNWNFILRADIGGFGVSSDFTWNIQGGCSWDATDYLTVVAQYRALSVDYSTGTTGTTNRFTYDTITHGPLIGLAFRF
ncbi:MAG: hypothetical protein GY702_03965 [Desulfobulbaceae bacterium]|nr:hypothetical protein [Desulfobulbaceae bacterium]